MQERPFGDTWVKVGEVGFGAWAAGVHQWGEVRDEDTIEAIRTARELGVTFYDTAQEYGCGHSEEIVGRALEGAGDDVFIATKVGKWWYGDTPDTFGTDWSPQFISGMCDGSLARLRRERIDLYQLHNPGVETCRRDETWRALENLAQAGKIRYYGASIGSEEELDLSLARGCKGIQFEYHILRPRHRAWIRKCAEAGAGVIIRTPLAYGALTGKYKPGYELPESDFRRENNWGGEMFRTLVGQAQELRFLEGDGQTMAQAALRFVLEETGVSVVIPGGKNPRQVRDNCAATDARLTHQQKKRIAELQAAWSRTK